MYFRFLAQFYNIVDEKEEVGFFRAAEYLQDSVDLTIEDRALLDKLIHWFDHELPIPDYYQDERNRQSAKSATSWFKDTAVDFIKGMNQLAKILTTYGVHVDRIHEKKLMGKVIYEDDYQVTILPFREKRKRVL